MSCLLTKSHLKEINNCFHEQGAHSDWIFDLTWLDDQFVVSGSRDGSLALWRVTDDMLVTTSNVLIRVYLNQKF